MLLECTLSGGRPESGEEIVGVRMTLGDFDQGLVDDIHEPGVHLKKSRKKFIVEQHDCAGQQIISNLQNSDVVWIYAKYKEVLQIPEWSGLMELLTQHEEHYESCFMCLPFINSPVNV
ncbi:hypothetical protein AVEN_62691-1 [Araneus ventricosus]|uniref:Uncharacterized protein n=1 Tax=Araneus ventricosus TaxID=182803 RepID=A0A4Y2FLZ4_ARAVE|nr:hypothetical protein AVEN_62691-1 [Araneus ventricosus]